MLTACYHLVSDNYVIHANQQPAGGYGYRGACPLFCQKNRISGIFGVVQVIDTVNTESEILDSFGIMNIEVLFCIALIM